MAVMVYRLMAKNLMTTIQVNFVMIPSKAGMRQHKLTRIVIKFLLIPSQPFLGRPL